MTEGITIDFVTELAWAHTHGMVARGLPELEIRGVPTFFAGAAADLLNGVCDYMIRTGERVKAGETMASNGAVFRFAMSKPIPGHEDPPEVERLRIVEVEIPCECCYTEPLIPAGQEDDVEILLARAFEQDRVNQAGADELLAPICQALAELGVTHAEVNYSGVGDEGAIDLIEFEPEGTKVPDDLTKAFEDWVISILPRGWEINAGSQGFVSLDVAVGRASFEHESNVAIPRSFEIGGA